MKGVQYIPCVLLLTVRSQESVLLEGALMLGRTNRLYLANLEVATELNSKCKGTVG